MIRRHPTSTLFPYTPLFRSERPTPIVVVSASVEAEDLCISMNALRAGALAVLEKPAGGRPEDYESFAERLCTHLTIMSQVKVRSEEHTSELSHLVISYAVFC